MEAAGLTVFDDNGDGLVHVRKSVTTDNSTQTLSEEVLVRQEHALIFVMRSKLSYYRGQSNNVPSVVAKMTLDAQGAIRLANSETMIPRLGGLIASDAIAKARPHASDPALAVVEITGSRPYPMDDFQVSFLTPVGS